MADLRVKIKDLYLKNPVMTASGTFGYGLEFADFVPLEGIGGTKHCLLLHFETTISFFEF